MLQFKRMHLAIAFFYTYFIITLPSIILWALDEFTHIPIGNLAIFALIAFGDLILAWFAGPIVSYYKARQSFFGTIDVKGKKLPSKEKTQVICLSILAVIAGYLTVAFLLFN